MFQLPRDRQAPLLEQITKNVLWRAVDVNRLVRLWCVPDTVLATLMPAAIPACKANSVLSIRRARLYTRRGMSAHVVSFYGISFCVSGSAKV